MAVNFVQLKTIFKLIVLKTFSFVNIHFWAYNVRCGLIYKIITTSCFFVSFLTVVVDPVLGKILRPHQREVIVFEKFLYFTV